MKKYTVGFIFNPSFSKVLLVRKKRPDWQKGKLNGIGGRIEKGEKSITCMTREVFEETGLQTKENDWAYVCKIKTPENFVDFYALIHRGKPHHASTTTDEKVGWFDVRKLPNNTLNNLHWLIPLAIGKIKHDEFKACLVNYRYDDQK